MEKNKIKLEAKELREKSIEDLEKIKLELEKRIMKNRIHKSLNKGNNIREDRRNISRINTVLQERNKEK